MTEPTTREPAKNMATTTAKSVNSAMLNHYGLIVI
jgi:hypothetical protein